MGLFRRGRGGYIDHNELSRREAYSGALFIFAAAVVVVKLAELEFDRNSSGPLTLGANLYLYFL